jgi:hypothetical protein
MVETDPDLVDIVKRADGLIQTPLNRLDGYHVRGVLDAVETLFFHHRNELAVHDDRSGIVLADGVGNSKDDHGNTPYRSKILAR